MTGSLFVSYAHENAVAVAKLVAEIQSPDWDVWWDQQQLSGSDFSVELDERLTQADIVVVVWTPESVDSEWVRSEATKAKTLGTLVPVMVEPATMPVAFINTSYHDLTDWSKGHYDAKWRRFVGELQIRIGNPGPSKPMGVPDELEIAWVRMSAVNEGVLEVAVRNLSAGPLIIDALTVHVEAEEAGWLGVLESAATYKLPIHDLAVGQFRTLPIAFEVESHRAELFEISLQTGRILDLRLSISYNRGREVSITTSTMD